jgi:hypothetical protein
MTTIHVYCDRCNKHIGGAFTSRRDTGYFTAGYYDVTPGMHGKNQWARYARDGERNVCDACMWADPKYIAEHGQQVKR